MWWVGDVVFAHDPETGLSGAREVLATWPHTDSLVEFEVGDSIVTTTEDHEFWNVTDQACRRLSTLMPAICCSLLMVRRSKPERCCGTRLM